MGSEMCIRDSDDLRIEVIGHDPFDGALDLLVAGKVVNGRRVVISYGSRLSEGPQPQVVFVSASAEHQLPAILSTLKNVATLTVSDIDRFAERGGTIGLVTDGGAIHFVINRTSASQARLRISSRLLSLATLIGHD